MGDRYKLNEDIVSLPATITAGGAFTYTSDIFNDFDKSFGSARLITTVADGSKVTDTFTLSAYASFDGTNFYKAVVDSTTAIAAGSDTEAVAQVVSYVISATGGDQVAEWNGKYFVVYSGATPYLVWFDVTGSDTKPVVTGYTTCTAYKINVSAAGDTADGIGAATEAAFDTAASGIFTSAYTAGTNTMAITAVTAGACTAPVNGLSTTVDSLAVTTQGANADRSYGTCTEIPAAPYYKVVLAGDASAALTAGHGIGVDLATFESDNTYRRDYFADVLPITTLAAGFVDQYSTVMETPTIAKKVTIWTYVGDRSKVTDAISYVLETSFDGVSWWVSSAAVTAGITNGSGFLNTVTTVTDASTYYLGKFFRIKLYRASGDVDAAIAASSGTKINVTVQY